VDIELAPTKATDAHFPFSPFFGLWLLHEASVTLVLQNGQPLWRSPEKPGGPIAREVSSDELAEVTDVETPDAQLVRLPTAAERRVLRERKRALVEPPTGFLELLTWIDIDPNAGLPNWSSRSSLHVRGVCDATIRCVVHT
jgi:hypothetical protein